MKTEHQLKNLASEATKHIVANIEAMDILWDADQYDDVRECDTCGRETNTRKWEQGADGAYLCPKCGAAHVSRHQEMVNTITRIVNKHLLAALDLCNAETDVSKMSVRQLHGYVNSAWNTAPDEERAQAMASIRDEVVDRLGDIMWDIGMLWDQVENVDAAKGGPVRHGTPNHRSMTYKCRKLAGFSYP